MTKYSPHVKWVVLPMHLLGVAAIWTLVTQFSWWMLPAIWLAWFVTGCLGTEIGLHRLFSHNAFKLSSKPLRWLLGWAACMGGQWSPIWWAALHQGYHHPGCDTVRDIHSPIHGKWHAYMGWMCNPNGVAVDMRFAKHLVHDPMQQFLHKNYLKVFWGTLTILFAVLTFKLFLICAVLPVLLAMHQENIVNLFCHTDSWFGYRNFEITDRSVNIYPLGLLFWGQGFHNNHHAKPHDYNFGVKPSEIDICRWVVPLLKCIDKL